jgi:4-carboxymuconolactone decarboxylase
MNAEQKRVYDKMVAGPRGVVVGPIRAALHSPELADRWQSLGEFLRYRSQLPERLSELAIIACARFWNSEVEWNIHAQVADRAGVSRGIIEAVRAARSPTFEHRDEAVVYEFTRTTLDRGQVPDELYEEAHGLFGDVGLVELGALIGYYTMVAMTLNVHEIPAPPEAVESWRTLTGAGPDLHAGTTRLPASAFSTPAPVQRHA